MFGSDTQSPAHPAILEAINAANHASAPSYGDDPYTARARAALAEVFETRVEVYPCVSGTAANALALSALCSTVGAVLCHHDAHVERDERGAMEFFTGGGKLQLLPGDNGKIDVLALDRALDARMPDFVHETPAEAISLTQLNECGCAYTIEEIAERTHRVRAMGLKAHMDGARFANAVCASSATPAQMTWRSGINVLTLGLTKNGALGCDVIVAFDPPDGWSQNLAARAKRAGHMPAKMRYLSAQILGALENDLWLSLAATANAGARRLAHHLQSDFGGKLAWPVDGNEVFVTLPADEITRLNARGVSGFPWPGGLHRFVCSWTTTTEAIDRALGASPSR